MTRVVKLKVEKINQQPTKDELKAFGLQFSKLEWNLLTNNKEFIELLLTNLKEAKKLSISLLKKD